MCITPTIASCMNVECCGIPNAIIILPRNTNANQCMCACTGTVNKAGDTLLSLAYKGGHWDMVKYLAITHHCDTTSNSNIFSAVVNDLFVIIIMLFMDSTELCNRIYFYCRFLILQSCCTAY